MVTKMVLEDFERKLADDIQKEMDFDILSSTLKDLGWSAVEFEPFNWHQHPDKIAAWVKQTAQGNYYHVGTKFIFERVEDASAAILKWK